MFGKLYPCAYAKDVFSIDYRKLYDHGYRGILFDVDNTLVHHNDDSTPVVEELFEHLKELGFQTVLISNNSKERLERFVRNMDTPFLHEAKKPAPQGYETALSMMNVSKEKAVMIGDQMFMDVRGANRAGIDSIMVHFVVRDPKAPIGVRRYLEKLILFFYRFAFSRHKLDFAIIKR